MFDIEQMAPVFANIYRGGDSGNSDGSFQFHFIVDGENRTLEVFDCQVNNSGKNDVDDFRVTASFELPGVFFLKAIFHARRKSHYSTVTPVRIYRDKFLYYSFIPAPEVSDDDLEHIMMILALNGGHTVERTLA